MKTRWSPTEAAKHLDALAVSGKSVESFAAQQELLAGRLRSWQKRLATRDERRVDERAPGCCRYV
jgi:hypothetical protein